jgi:hypothetical protein
MRATADATGTRPATIARRVIGDMLFSVAWRYNPGASRRPQPDITEAACRTLILHGLPR